MAEIKLTYDARNIIAKKTLAYVLSLGIFKEVAPKNAVQTSLDEIKKGKVNAYKNSDDLFKKVLNV